MEFAELSTAYAEDSLAAVAAGADGLMIEVHDQPECALCDGSQSLKPKKFKEMLDGACARMELSYSKTRTIFRKYHQFSKRKC